MLYVYPAAKRALLLGFVALAAILCTSRAAAAQEASRFELDRQAATSSRAALPESDLPRLDRRLNPIRTPQQQAEFDTHRAALRLRAQQRIRTNHPGRVWAPHSGSTDERSTAKTEATTVFTVNTDFDDPDYNPGDGICYDGFSQEGTDECTLRAAIEEANLTPGTDLVIIRIDMLSPSRGFFGNVAYDETNDLWTLLVNNTASHNASGPLPPITRENVLIDGTTQSDGSGIGDFPDAYCGQPIIGDTSIVKVAIDGSVADGVSDVGLDIQADNVEIRGIAVNNFPGNGIYASGVQNLKVECVYLGTDHFARSAAPNGSNGLAEQGGSGFAMKNSIVSGNALSGVHAASPYGTIDSTFFGLDVTGQVPIGNTGTGLYVPGDSMAVTTIFASGNDDGLWLVGNGSTVTNSFFGLGLDRTTAVANDAGIRINGDGNLIGGPAGMRVVASGNTSYGISLAAESEANLIAGTVIGADPSGSFAIGNGTGILDGGVGNMIGEEVPPPPGPGLGEPSAELDIPEPDAWSNLISGNTSTGITSSGSSIIVRNYVGTDSAGTTAIPNVPYGINLTMGTNHEIGRTSGNGNLISGNSNRGVYIGPLVTDAFIRANYIGTDKTGTASLPNGSDGIRVDAGGLVTVGSGNTIAFNSGAGVAITGAGQAKVTENQIFSNSGLGIDLAADGISPNDGGTPPDTDGGPNALQNFPVISDAVQINPTTIAVAFDLESTPSTKFRFDYYRSDTPDRSGNGEGAVWVKTSTSSTNAEGALGLGLGFTLIEMPIGSWVTVTATNPQGETSEFSNAVQVSGESVSLTGSKVFLEGPFAGGSMTTTLYANGDIPLSQPYDDASFDGTLQEVDDPISVSEIPTGTVDWVVLSLRTGTDAPSEVARTVGFVKSDGSLVSPDDDASITFGGIDGTSYYLVVCHRNHLCAMSSSALDFSSGSSSWDFTTGLSQAFTGGGAAMKALAGGVYGLFAADSNVDGQVTAPDFNLWNAATTAGETGYPASDHNLDGQVTAPDFNLWNANTTAGATSRVPN